MLAAILVGLPTVEQAWARGQATSLVTAVVPTLWNSLPEHLPQPNITFGQFKRSLKTFMFGHLGRGALFLNIKGAD